MSNRGVGSHVKSGDLGHMSNPGIWVTCQIAWLGHMSNRMVGSHVKSRGWVTCQIAGLGHMSNPGLGHMSNRMVGSHVKQPLWAAYRPASYGGATPRKPNKLFVNNANSISCSCMLWNIVIYLQISDVIRYLISSPNNGVSLTNKK